MYIYAIHSIHSHTSRLTEPDRMRLGEAFSQAWEATEYAVWEAADDAASDAAALVGRSAIYTQVRWNSNWLSAVYASRGYWVASSAADYALLAVLTYDLAREDGPYRIVQRDLLLTPWVNVFGLPAGLPKK